MAGTVMKVVLSSGQYYFFSTFRLGKQDLYLCILPHIQPPNVETIFNGLHSNYTHPFISLSLKYKYCLTDFFLNFIIIRLVLWRSRYCSTYISTGSSTWASVHSYSPGDRELQNYDNFCHKVRAITCKILSQKYLALQTIKHIAMLLKVE